MPARPVADEDMAARAVGVPLVDDGPTVVKFTPVAIASPLGVFGSGE